MVASLELTDVLFGTSGHGRPASTAPLWMVEDEDLEDDDFFDDEEDDDDFLEDDDDDLFEDDDDLDDEHDHHEDSDDEEDEYARSACFRLRMLTPSSQGESHGPEAAAAR